MNFLKNYYILLILLITTCLVNLFISYENKQIKKLDKQLDNQIDRVGKCIDFDNKNKRSINENIKLSEYCIDNFGTIKLSQ